MAEFLDFADISKKVTFKELFNWLNIPFDETDKELKGDEFIITKEKNLYINPKRKDEKGSVINFLCHHKQIDLRSSASELKKQFLSNQPKQEEAKELPNLELHYTDQLMTYDISSEIAKTYEIGLVKQRSIMSGKIALKVYNPDESVAGYIGYQTNDGKWFYPKGFKRPVWNLNRLQDKEFIFLTTNPFDALKIISFGYHHVACLLGNSMTDDQLTQLQNMPCLQSIALLHNDPMNIVSRVAKHLFIRYDIPPKPIRETDHSEFQQFYLHNPS